MDAKDAVTRRARRELHTSDMQVEQRPQIIMPNDGPLDQSPEALLTADGPDFNDYADALAFAEEPVTINIGRSSEKFAPRTVHCAVNGKGAEVLINGKWCEMLYLPVGVPLTTKRKYVEVLARSKTDTVETNVVERDNEDPVNAIDRHTSLKAPFSVLHDANPRGADWLNKLVYEG
jgi:hypothetical protein